ncbi:MULTISPECIES: ABC transporter ATP-binding protein [unclassified Meridianimarinicoccus]|uniref:ABC transporter ATP-binding protein n=1 Tax=unclassified Meridianimarinicoccus TaxID=2923344 RepID=UPI001868217B|nr:sn-glycerol-3-phosphate ABC transporter ATP-binding protein UgpC [Fluviibacterium sp. MJW13]
MAGVTLNAVRKDYGTFLAIPELDLEIEDGEFCVFVGPSGCGKSTLLRTIAGLEDLTDGQILIGDQDVSDRHPGERGVAMVFQNYALYPHMNVRQNMGYALRLAREPKSTISQKVERAADILGLRDHLDRKPAELSGGQRQRVAIGRAIVRNPKVFLFDEPLSNLDAELRTRMRLELSELHQTLSTTMIYVTHDQVEAMTLADKIVVLRAGRIEQVGSPLELYDNPVNKFVAGFLGSPSMNFLPATMTANGLQFADLDGACVDFGTEPTPGKVVMVGIRPEHLEISEDGAPLPLRSVEQLGGVTYGYAILQSGEEFCVDLKGRRDIRAGDTIRLLIPPSRALVFDADTELRIR